MAQGDTPVYQLQDPDGTVLAEFRHDSNGNLIVEQLDGSNIDFKQADASNLNSVSTDQITSDSLPTWRVYKDNGDVVAVDETDTEIARDSDAATVWQAALDAANADYDPSEKFEPVAVIDAGMAEFSLSATVEHKPGTVLRHVRFESSGVGSGAAYRIGSSSSSATDGGLAAEFVVVRDAGDVGIECNGLVHSTFRYITIENATNNGVDVLGCIGNQFDKIHARKCGGDGFLLADGGSSNTKTNANNFTNCRAQSNAVSGFKLNGAASVDVSGNRFEASLAENNTSHGWLISQARDTTIVDPWSESNGNRGILLTGGARHTIKQPTLWANDGGGGGNQGIRVDGADNTEVIGALGGNDKIAVANGDDTVLRGLLPADLFVDNATRTRWDGVIGGGPLGGVDLSTTTGQFEDDRAVADGTSAAAAGDIANWDSANTQWRVFQPSTTV